MSTRPAARARYSFSKLQKVFDGLKDLEMLEVPNLIAIQRSSFEWFLNDGLRETIDDISPIEDFTGTLAVQFGKYTLGGWEPGMPFDHIQPNDSIKDCREKDLTYAAPLTMEVAFINRETGEIREQKVFMGDLPLMTDWGTFIINGTERVIVTQLVRSPGAYVMEPKDREKQVFIANLMPSRGSWVELEIDKKGLVHVRIDRKRKLPVTTLLFALGYTRDDVANLFRHPEDPDRVNPFIQMTLDKDATEGAPQAGDRKSLNEMEKIVSEIQKLAAGLDDASTDERAEIEAEIEKLEKKLDARSGDIMQHALIEVFKKQRPGEPPTVDNSRALVRSLFFDPKRYDLTKVGRYKLDARLGLDIGSEVRTLTSPRFTGRQTGMTDDLVELIRRLVDLPIRIGLPEESKDFAADAATMPRDEIAGELDEYEHFGNRRLRTVGELIQEAFRIGLYRMERVVRERMSTEDVDTITPQTIINIRPVVAALKEFFGSSQLSQFMDQTNSLAGLTHRRRLSALGAGGLTRERAPIEVRDVHATHYGRMCPIETPEGPNIGLIGSLGSHATVNEFGFIQTPYRQVKNGKVTGGRRAARRHPGGAQDHRPGERRDRREGQARRPGAVPQGRRADPGRPDRRRVHGRLAGADRLGRDGPDPVPRAQRRQPGPHGRQHAAPGGAAHDHRGPAGGHRHRAPRGGGHGRRRGQPRGRARWRRSTPTTSSSRTPRASSSTTSCTSSRARTRARSSTRSRSSARARRCGGPGAGRRQLDRRRRAGAGQERARRLHELGGLQLRGRDHHLGAPGQGRRAVVDPHRGLRDRRPHHQAGRRGDHPRHPEPLRGVPQGPRRARHRAHRRRGRVGRPPGRARSRRRARPS